jgi:hypothetical protein
VFNFITSVFFNWRCKNDCFVWFKKNALPSSCLSACISLSPSGPMFVNVLEKCTKYGQNIGCITWGPKYILYWQRHMYRGADKSLARPGRKQATATEDFDQAIRYMHILSNTTIYEVVCYLLYVKHSYMFRPQMLTIFRLYNENLSISYTCVCRGCIGCREGV